MFGFGAPELLIILFIAVLVFGGKKLPEIGAGIGKAIGSFKKEINEVEEAGRDLKKSLPGVQEVAEVKKTIKKARDVSRTLGR